MLQRLLVFLSLIALPATALALGPLPAPSLKDGRHVHVVPDGWSPPGIGQPGLDRIEEALKALHFSFQVVIAHSIPHLTVDQQRDAAEHGYVERGDDLTAAYAIDQLAADWAVAEPSAWTDTTSVFLLAYDPHKYRMLAASRWKNELGLEKDALTPFMSPFIMAVKGTPKDPTGGITRTAQGFDDHVFDQTDPVRVAERARQAEVARQEAEKADKINRAYLAEERAKKELADAQAAHANALADAQKLLGDDQDTLPDASQLRKMVQTMAANDPPADVRALSTETAALTALYAPVLKAHDDIVIAKATTFTVHFLQGLIFGLVVVVAFQILRKRRRRLGSLRQTLDQVLTTRRKGVMAAAGRFVDAHGERDAMTSLADCTGKTKELWDWIAAELDDIWTGIKALETRLDQIQAMAAKGSFFNLKALDDAIRAVDAPFEFDTGKIQKDELFGSETKTITVKPKSFMDDLDGRFKALRAKWFDLGTVANLRLKSGVQLFPHDALTAMIDRAQGFSIPLAWLSDHPLAGDDAADAKVWAELSALARTDPVACQDKVIALGSKSAEVDRRLESLAELVYQVGKLPDVTKIDDLVLKPIDDPMLAQGHVDDAKARFRTLLETAAADKDLPAVQAQVAKIIELSLKAVGPAEVARNAVAGIDAAIKDAEDAEPDAQPAERRFAAALSVHSDQSLLVVKGNITSATTLITGGRAELARARSCQQAKRTLDAFRHAVVAKHQYESAYKALQATIRAIDALDEARADYLAREACLGKLRQDAAGRLAALGVGGPGLPVWVAPVDTNQGPIDWVFVQAGIKAHEAVVARRIQEAQAAHDRAEAQAAEAAAKAARAARRAADEAAESRRRASYSSYSSDYASGSSSYSSGSSYSSSSSSSSYDSGSSSSGGSSDSGGGSSSSGGDW